jgi:hypothetical protein
VVRYPPANLTTPLDNPDPIQGWVERSDTHQLLFAKMMGFAKGSTHPCTANPAY